MNLTAALASPLERNAERNQKIRTALEAAFRREVKVTSSDDPYYEWVFIEVDWHPRDTDQADRLRILCRLLLSVGLGLASSRYHIRFA